MLTTFFFRLTVLAAFFLVLTSGSAVPQNLSARMVDNADGLVARDAVLPPYCVPIPNQPWSYADGAAINDGINYLNGLDVPCYTGPYSCARVSCSYQSAIKLCNDNNYLISFSCTNVAGFTSIINDYTISFSCTIVAQYVQLLYKYCAVFPPHSNYLLGGQIFDTAGWNVVVYDDSC